MKANEPVAARDELLSTGLRADAAPGDRSARPRSVELAQLELGEANVEMNQSEATRVKLELSRKGRRGSRSRRSRASTAAGPPGHVAVDGNGNKTAKVIELEIKPR